MKKIFKNIVLTATAALTLTGCLDETTPSGGMLQEQVESSKSGIAALSNAIPKSLITLGYSYIGGTYGSIQLMTDILTGQAPIATTTWDYFNYVSYGYLGSNYAYCYDVWNYHYSTISRANLTIAAVNNAGGAEEASDKYAGYLGNALAYRAFAYLNLARLEEYKSTGDATLDAYAQSHNLYGLTAPIVTEKTTEKESRNNPRVPFYVMDRFILTDLNKAEKLLKGYTRESANEANEAVVYGLKARLWLDLASRFDYKASELQEQLAHEDDDSLAVYDKLGITTAKECYANAAKYARLAINEGYRPVTKQEWYNNNTGFNTANDAWIWAMQIGTNDVSSDSWATTSLTSYMSSETEFGVAGLQTNQAYREIDKQLFGQINKADWRRATWVAPEDAGKSDSVTKYTTLLTAAKFANLPAYAGLKFKPAGGNMTDYKAGCAVDMPLMRVEEMYFIEAEATAFTQGLQAGQKLLEDFMNKYRCDVTSDNPTPFKCTSTNTWDFEREVVTQKRIEFWGEGVVYYDYKRLRMDFNTAYDGSNTYYYYQQTNAAGYVHPYMNFCIPNREIQNNKGLVNNPDPKGE